MCLGDYFEMFVLGTLLWSGTCQVYEWGVVTVRVVLLRYEWGVVTVRSSSNTLYIFSRCTASVFSMGDVSSGRRTGRFFQS